MEIVNLTIASLVVAAVAGISLPLRLTTRTRTNLTRIIESEVGQVSEGFSQIATGTYF